MEFHNKYDVGIYCRLSKDDGSGYLESMSIENQKKLLTDYVNEKGWNLQSIYIDDGFSGTDFERPEFLRMVNDAEQGRINCIVTKDLSRIGRDYIKTGYYTEVHFSRLHVRFIAINDSVDTAKQYNELAPFQNIVNEWYPREISKKVRQVKRARAMEGAFMGSQAPYGYKKSPTDKHKLIIDDEAARIVRRVFLMFLAGDSARLIAEKLNGEKIDSPRVYHYKKLGKPNPYHNGYLWGSQVIMALTKNPVYLGHMVQGKRQVVSFKTKQREAIHPNNWIVVKNTHEPIIDEQTWKAVQEITSERRIIRKGGNQEVSPFAGLLICADCGKKLVSSVKKSTNKSKRIYKCSTYSNNGRSACTAHYIAEDNLFSFLQDEVSLYSELAANSSKKFYRKLADLIGAKQEEELEVFSVKLDETQRRINLIDDVVKKMCEESCEGNIARATLSNILLGYHKEQNFLQIEIRELKKQIAELKDQEKDISGWIAVLKEYLHVNQLNRKSILDLVENIIVHEAENMEGINGQKIVINFKYVGNLKREHFENL